MPVDKNYAYAVSRVRAIENKLLDRNSFERMLEARSPDEALKVLVEAGYGYSAGEGFNINDYEALLKQEGKKVYGLLSEMAPDTLAFDVFLLKNDYHNIKVILKAEFSGNIDENLLLEPGSIPLSNLKMMLRERQYSDMAGVMREAIEECFDVYSRTGDPQSIDIILDSASFSHMRQIAESVESSFLNRLLEIITDLTNTKTLLRCRKLEKSEDFLKRTLLLGGSIDTKLFVDNLREPLGEFIKLLNLSGYKVIGEEGVESFHSTGSLTKLEKLSDDYITEYVKKAKYIILGIEPLIGYLMAKETEIKNARIVMVGKINNMPNETIRERLRETYV